MNLKRIAVLAMVVMLVSSASVASPAAAQSVETSSHLPSGAVSFWVDTVQWGSSVMGPISGFLIQEDDYSVTNTTDDLETKTNVNSNARVVDQKNQETFTVVDNYLEDSRNIAWIKAKKAVLEELNSGGSATSARVAAKTAIRDYYATKQKNLIAQWNSTVASIEYNRGIVENDSSINNRTVYPELGQFIEGETTDPPATYNNAEFRGFGTTNLGLVNSSSATVKTYKVRYNADGTQYGLETISYHAAGPITADIDGGGRNQAVHSLVYVEPPTTDYERATFVNASEFATRWDSMVTQKDQMVSNVDPFVNSTFDAYAEGEINSSDIVDPYMLASEYTAEYNSTGYYSYAVAQNALLGLQTPNLNATSFMNVTHDGTKYNGLLMVEDSGAFPNDTIEVNKTYNLSNISSPVHMVRSDGGMLTWETGNLTVTSAEDKDGTKVQNVTYRTYNYQTANATALQEQLDQLTELQEEIEELKAMQAGGSLPFDMQSPYTWVGILAILGALVARQ